MRFTGSTSPINNLAVCGQKEVLKRSCVDKCIDQNLIRDLFSTYGEVDKGLMDLCKGAGVRDHEQFSRKVFCRLIRASGLVGAPFGSGIEPRPVKAGQARIYRCIEAIMLIGLLDKLR